MKIKIISLILCATVILTVFSACSKNNDKGDETTLGNESTSQSTTEEKSTESTVKNEETTKEDKTTTKKQTTEKHTAEQVQALTSQEALELLEKHYGNDYHVNGRVQDGDVFSYHIIKNNQKYATVKVNLKTREATETITESDKESHFTL